MLFKVIHLNELVINNLSLYKCLKSPIWLQIMAAYCSHKNRGVMISIFATTSTAINTIKATALTVESDIFCIRCPPGFFLKCIQGKWQKAKNKNFYN